MSRSPINKHRRDLLRMLTLGGAATGMGLAATPAFASSATSGKGSHISNLRMSSNNQRTRVVLDLNHATDHHVFTLAQPNRIVIDFDHASVTGSLRIEDNPLIKDIRYAPRNGNGLRVVLDLKQAAQPSSFLLSPSSSYDHYRLVLDLHQENSAPTKSVEGAELRDMVVMLDPGHGGKDPGAIGPGGTYEKNVVLPIARKLQQKLNSQRGVRAYLTRDTDVYLHLRERTRIAHEHNADLFMSIHADAFRDPSVTGSSVYVLSEGGASSEMARLLAKSQNAVDPLVNNIDLSDKSEMLKSVLLDLSQTASINSSDRLARQLLQELKNKHNNRINRAAFVVLKSPDIPSVLVETAFISNPRQEKLLRTTAFQQRIAGSMEGGVMSYLKQFAPTDSLIASLSRETMAG